VTKRIGNEVIESSLDSHFLQDQCGKLSGHIPYLLNSLKATDTQL